MHTERCFAIKIPKNGEKLEELSVLKEKIAYVIKNQHYWKRRVKPASAILERVLQEEKTSRTIHMKELLELNNTLGKFRLDDSEIITLLKYLHQAGTLLYFEEPDLKDTIILDVQWLVGAFKSILRFNVGIEKANNSKVQTFKKTGELDEAELLKILEERLYEKKDYKILTSIMERLGLLAVCHSENRLWYYFPSMNRRKFENKPFEDVKKSSILLFQFEKEKQLPIFVFYKFVVKCMKFPRWEIYIEKNCPCIYDDAACFSFKGHIVLLCIYNFQIQVQVCRNAANEIDTNRLSEIKSELENTMEEFRSRNYTFEIGYKCLNGKFHKEGLNFYSEKELMVEGKVCKFCSDFHELGKEIYWVSLIFILLLLISEF